MSAIHPLSHPLDFKELFARLQESTPPPDEVHNTCDDEARGYLAREGCPPCNQPCVPYWRNSDQGDLNPLCGQAASWRTFRCFRLTTRKGKRLHLLRRNIRAHRRAHRIETVRVDLHSNPDEQSRMQTWIEYQEFLFSDDAPVGIFLGRGVFRTIFDIARQSSAKVKHQCFIDHVLPWTEDVRLAHVPKMLDSTTTASRQYHRAKPNREPRHPRQEAVVRKLRSRYTGRTPGRRQS